MSDLKNFENLKELNKNNKIETIDINDNINNKNNSILSILMEKRGLDSFKINDLISFTQIKENEIKKFDELNNSLDNISDFDLEKSEYDSLSFNSSEENDDKEIENIIIFKSKLNNQRIEENKEFEFELDEEFEKIQREILESKINQ